MKPDLEPVKTILRTFLKEIEDVKAIRKGISSPQQVQSFTLKDRMPVFDRLEFNAAQDSYWAQDDAYIWLYADSREYSSFMHAPVSRPIPEYYSQLAWPVYKQWRQEKKEVFTRSCDQIPEPLQEISLADYLKELALLSSEGNEHRDVWIESLNCFLHFLREDTDLDQRGPLEILFPSKDSCKGKEFRKGYEIQFNGKIIEEIELRYILRRTEESMSPIDIFATSEILMNLAKAVLEGRPQSQRSAAEALGFAWLCHAVGCSRLVTRDKIIFSTKTQNFKQFSLKASKEPFKPNHFIGVDSLFGVVDVPISKIIYEFLLALPRLSESNLIFSMDWDTVCRTFRERGVRQSRRARHLGRITFLTFMTPPHHAIGHR